MAKKGKWFKMSEMTVATGHTPQTITKLVRDGIIERMDSPKGKRYWLPEGQVSFSLAGAKKLREQQNELQEGKLLTREEFAEASGIALSTIYKSIQFGSHPSEKDEDGKVCIRFYSKEKNLRLFQEYKAAWKQDQENQFEDGTFNYDRAAKVKVGTMLTPKLWAEIAGGKYQSIIGQAKKGIFDHSNIEILRTPSGSVVKIEWPGVDKAIKIVEVIATVAGTDDKKFLISEISNSIDDEAAKEDDADFQGDNEQVEEANAELKQMLENNSEKIANMDFEALEARIKKLEDLAEEQKELSSKLLMKAAGL